MSGETETSVSGWTVDTLRDALHRELELISGASREKLTLIMSGFDDRIGAQNAMLDERYATQTKALDAAFLAQQTAMKTAFDAADKAVAAALESAEKAVTKAETAAEKRFESVNEFRQQLADQASTFISRTEYDVRVKALTDLLSSIHEQLTETANQVVPRKENEAWRSAQTDKFDLAIGRLAERTASLELQMQALNSLGLGREQSQTEDRQDSRRANEDATFVQTEKYNAVYRSRSQISLAIAAFSGLVAVIAVAVAVFLH